MFLDQPLDCSNGAFSLIGGWVTIVRYVAGEGGDKHLTTFVLERNNIN